MESAADDKSANLKDMRVIPIQIEAIDEIAQRRLTSARPNDTRLTKDKATFKIEELKVLRGDSQKADLTFEIRKEYSDFEGGEREGPRKRHH